VTDDPTRFLHYRYTRRGFMAVAGSATLLAACGGSTDTADEADSAPAATSTPGGEAPTATGTLLYYNWADYVNPETYPAFTKETGLKIKKDFYVSNEELQAKLQGGARGFDLIVPTGYMIQILAEEGLLQKIDQNRLPTVQKNIDPRYRGLPFDPKDEYSVPKDWGTTGFMYRSDLVKERPTTWREFVDLTKGPYSKKVTLLDGVPEVIGSIAVMLGFSYNTDDRAELDQVKKELVDLKPHVLAITSTQYKQMLTSGRAVMALGWNGDGAAVAAKKPATYVVAEEGGEFWVDSYAIPVGAKNPDAAYVWMDYVYDPENNARETEYTYYGSPVKRELLEPVIDKKVLADPNVFPPPETFEKLQPNEITPEGTKLRDRIWTEFKAA
jgi:spermidine/putrescine transport system substrate-binding protein